MIVPLTRANLAHLKRRLVDRMPDVRSGHADEAIASGMGFNTYAALLASLKAPATRDVIVALSETLLVNRLRSFGYHPDILDVTTAAADAEFPDVARSLLSLSQNETRSMLQGAVGALSENTGAARRALYETMRAAWARDLHAVSPPVPMPDVTARRLQFEDCIREVEQRANSANQATVAKLIDETIEKLRGIVANQN